MPIPLKYNTASQEIALGFFLDSGDGDAIEDGLTITNTDIWLWKSGATTLANKNSGGATHISGGIYYAILDATDTNTYGPLIIFVHESGSLTVRLECVVMNADAYDALYAANGTGNIEANVVEIEGADPSDTIRDSVVDDATRIDGSAVNALPNAAAIQSELEEDGASVLDIIRDAVVSGTYGLDAIKTLIDAIKAITDVIPNSGALTDIAEIRTDTENIQGRLPAALVSGAMDSDVSAMQAGVVTPAAIATDAIDSDALADDALADIQAEAEDALETYDLDHLIQVAAGAEDPTVDSYLDRLMNKDGSQTFDPTSDSLEAIVDAGGSADWSTGEREQIRDALGVDGSKTAATGGDLQDVTGKLPTNNIMGSSVATDMDDEIDAIKAVTDLLPNAGALTDIDTGVDAVEAKLPTNYIMGSAVQTDKDDDIDGIKAVTDVLPNSGALTDIDTGVDAIEAKLPTNNIMGSSVVTDMDDEIDAIKAVTDLLPNAGALTDIDTGVDAIEAKLPTDYIMGSAVQTSLDDDIGRIEAVTDLLPEAGALFDLADIKADTENIQTRIPAALVSGAMDSDVSVIQTDAVSAAALAAAAVDKIRDGLLPTQNAVFNNLEFLFVAASDHVTPVTGATGMGVTRSIDGGAFGAGTGTGPAQVGNGIYQYDASAADMNGGIITFRFTGTGGTPGAPDDCFVTIVTGGGV